MLQWKSGAEKVLTLFFLNYSGTAEMMFHVDEKSWATLGKQQDGTSIKLPLITLK